MSNRKVSYNNGVGRFRRRAFTLIELIAAMCVIATLAAITAPMLGNKRNADLQTGAIQLMGQLELARQTARVLNRSVEVRLYGANGAYTSVQLYADVDDAPPSTSASAGSGTTNVSAKPCQRRLYLPSAVRISTSTTFSSVLRSDMAASGSDGQGQYRSFSYTPAGTTDLPSGTQPTLTLVFTPDAASAVLPTQYATIAIDQALGRPRMYRP